MTVKQKIELLREEMKKNQVAAFIVYSADPHMSEYLPEPWKERVWLSGFTGSYGYMVVTMDKAALWTDGRYFVQAREELRDTGIKMMKDKVADAINYLDWISEEIPKNGKVAVNTYAISHRDWEEARAYLQERNHTITHLPLLDEVWKKREQAPKNEIFVQPVERAGKTVKEKLTAIREEMKKKRTEVHILSSLDDVAWTLNLRGSDIAFNPVFLGYVLLTLDRADLYVNTTQLNEEAKQLLRESDVNFKDYHAFYTDLEQVKDKSILLSPTANQAIFKILKDKNRIVKSLPPGNLMKAVKNQTELDGFRTVMRRDGAAMVNFLYWLKNAVGKEELNEYNIGKRLYDFRAKGKNFVGESFATIVGYNGNDALPHYSAKEEGSNAVHAKGSILIDSGGQYLEGTTDITRVIPLGEMSEAFKRDYTTVMKAYLALERVKFPRGTRGNQLDAFARMPLWLEGKDYNHGTGHGIGSFLNVHEGPMSIRTDENPYALQPGMVLSNEPGYYEEGKYGIRHENLLAVVPFQTTEWNEFYEFEVLTLCPFFKEALVKEMMTEKEIKQFNSYHQRVKTELEPLLQGAVKEWFLEQVKPL